MAEDQRAALEARIGDDPGDVAAWQVYADFLQHQGDPLGELIVLQLAAARDPVGKTRTPAQRAFVTAFKKHAPRLLGTLVQHGASTTDPAAPPLIWRNGVLWRAELGRTAVDGSFVPQAQHLAALLPHPAARMLGELAIRCADQAAAAAALASMFAQRPPLVELELYARGELGELSALWAALPKLRRVTVVAHGFELGDLELPSARRVELHPLALSARSMRAIAAAPWPRLERLELRFSGHDLPPHAALADLAPLLARADLPALSILKLRGLPYAGAVLRAIADGPLAPQLTLLDVKDGNYNPHDLAYLAARKERFGKLREIWVQSPHATLKNVEQALSGIAKHVVTRDVRDLLAQELGAIDRRVLDRYRDPPEDP